MSTTVELVSSDGVSFTVLRADVVRESITIRNMLEDADDGQDTIKVKDPVTGEVKFKTRKKQFADPDDDHYRME